VSAADHTVNFGAQRALRVAAAPLTRTYVRFDADYLKNRDVKRVNLLVFSRSRSRLGFNIRLVTGRWRERKITFANAPRLSARFISSGPLGRRTWKAIDVTALVLGEKKEISLALATGARSRVELGSRESGLTGPRLVVELDPAVEKDPVSTEVTPLEPAP
jgi:hypothetical protein